MISAYELRLGNHILVNQEIRKISIITSTTIFTIDADETKEEASSETNLETVNPIPLTDDVLKECGFVYHDYFKFWQLVTTGIRSEMDINSDYDLIDFMRKTVIKKMTSLHQLQNVYFVIKGRELKWGSRANTGENKKLAISGII
jgi:hypothetical protein